MIVFVVTVIAIVIILIVIDIAAIQPINYEVFKVFLETYLEAEIPEELSRHLFLSFLKRPSSSSGRSILKKECSIKDVAVVASQMACAPLVRQAPEPSIEGLARDWHFPIGDKLHGITEKLHSLGQNHRPGRISIPMI